MTATQIRAALKAARRDAEYAVDFDPMPELDSGEPGRRCHECDGIHPRAEQDGYHLMDGQRFGHTDDCRWGQLMAWAKEG